MGAFGRRIEYVRHAAKASGTRVQAVASCLVSQWSSPLAVQDSAMNDSESASSQLVCNKPPVAPSPPSPTPSLPSSETDAEAVVVRPSLYRHEPRPRLALLEEYYGNGPPVALEILEELKSDRLAGIYNLSFLLLIFCLIYLFVRNIMELGFRAGPSAICYSAIVHDLRMSLKFVPQLPILFLYSFQLVKLLASSRISTSTILILHATGVGTFFAISTSALLNARMTPLAGLTHGLLNVIIVLKQHSYVLTNILLAEETAKRRVARYAKRKINSARNSSTASVSSAESTAVVSTGVRQRGSSIIDDEISYVSVGYPRNVTVSNLMYFVVAPTLVYETSYPRTRSIRLGYVLRYSAQVLVTLCVQYVLVMQFCVPVWRNVEDAEHLWWFVMKLALPGFAAWLLMFWGFFHCALNVIAEVTRFADREFYREWWNATTLHEYWRNWNILVHEWCVRHLYVESVSRHKINAQAAALGTFVMSAVLHEYVCVVGFGMLRPYMFTAMLMQAPMMRVSERWRGQRVGNCLMWLMLFIGQSTVAVLYVRDFVKANGTVCEN